jgi:hypothetical protein
MQPRLTRENIKGCIAKKGGFNPTNGQQDEIYLMFFEILKEEYEKEYYFNIIGLEKDELKALKPKQVITKRYIKQFFKKNFDINDMGKYKEEKEIIDFYFPCTMYENEETGARYFVFKFCQKYLEDRNLLQRLPSITVSMGGEKNA